MKQKRKNFLAALAASTAKNWPLSASFVALGAATLVAAAPTTAAAIAIWAGNATIDQKLTFGIAVNTAVIATLVVNNGFRMASLERDAVEQGVATEKMAKLVKKLTRQIQRLSNANRYELVPDSAETWARLAKKYRAIAPSLGAEVEIKSYGKSERRYQICKERLQVWLLRAETSDIEIIIPRGRLVTADNVVSFQSDKMDLEQLRKVALFFRALIDAGLNDTHRIRLLIADRGRHDLKSFFITHVRQQDGSLRKAAILYSNGLLPEHDGERLVAIHYGEGQLARAEARWSEMRKNSTPWTVQQLINCFAPFLPESEADGIPDIPSSFTFEANDPYHQDNRALEMVDTGDGHFAFRDTKRSFSQKAAEIARKVISN